MEIDFDFLVNKLGGRKKMNSDSKKRAKERDEEFKKRMAEYEANEKSPIEEFYLNYGHYENKIIKNKQTVARLLADFAHTQTCRCYDKNFSVKLAKLISDFLDTGFNYIGEDTSKILTAFISFGCKPGWNHVEHNEG